MPNAYTPGLTVSGDIVVRRTRRLPIKGEVLVSQGAVVEPHQVIARAMLPGPLQTIKLAEKLSVEPKEAPSFFRLKVGDSVEKGEVVAETKGFMGRFGRTTVMSEYAGTVESISEISGNVLIREPAIPVDVTAYIHGMVAGVILREGAVIETRGAMVQGIFGVGGERNGIIRVVAKSTDHILTSEDIHESDKNNILIGGAGISLGAIKKAAEVGALGLVAGGIKDSDLVSYLGYDIGVAITGQEQIPLSILVTEGFGYLRMAEHTLKLLTSLEGKSASINGATQIRAGVIRPEIIVPLTEMAANSPTLGSSGELKLGTPIRVIREPYFGRLGSVSDLPAQLMMVGSGTEVRVLKATLEDGEVVVVPRANVEIIAS